MKSNFCCLLLLISIFTACAKDKQVIKMGVINDIHFLSENLMDDGLATKNYEITNGKMITDIPDVLDVVLDDYLNSDIEVLLIPGDLTKDGERQSHLDFVKKLGPLKDKGVRIYVIPGNHDINVPNSVGFENERTYPTENISPSDFTDIYGEFGYNAAIKRDMSSLSYVAQLADDTWLLAIDASLYKEYTNRTISAGRISPQTEQWILDVLNEANAKNVQVIGMMHHGLVEHIAFQSVIFKDYLVEDWQRLAPLFADNGMKIIFTGHFHANDITEFTSGKGNNIYDVETGSLAAYPFAYRFAELTKDRISISTKNVNSTPKNLYLSEMSKNQLRKIARAQAFSKINNLGIAMPDSIKNAFIDLATNIFLIHLAGDEKLDDSLRESIRTFYLNIDPSESIPIDKFEIDLYPSDNNVEIVF